METPERDNFKVNKLKVPANGGLSVDFKYKVTVSDATHEIQDTHKSSIDAHPDLLGMIRGLKEYYMEAVRIKSLYRVVHEERFGASEVQKKVIDSAYSELKNNIRITQISVSGAENTGVVITGVIDAVTGQGMALSTHQIKLDDFIYGWEEDLQETIEAIEAEVYDYMYNRKVAQPDLFQNSLADNEEESKTEENEKLEEQFEDDGEGDK